MVAAVSNIGAAQSGCGPANACTKVDAFNGSEVSDLTHGCEGIKSESMVAAASKIGAAKSVG
eukprot:12398590-Karenia_brevis.AAC.1